MQTFAHILKKSNDNQEGNNLAAHRQYLPFLVKTLQQDSISSRTMKQMQGIATTWVAFGLDSLSLLLL